MYKKYPPTDANAAAGGELRGGAWVVVDPTINEDQMEMFVDPSARGGILEPAGIVEIKYRKAQILSTMGRLDPEIAALNLQVHSYTPVA